jgi:hypothetical protein
MLKIKNVKVKKYEFVGEVSIHDLSKEQLEKLKIDIDTAHSDEVEAYGEFTVKFDGDSPCVTVDGCSLEGAQGLTLELADNEYDQDTLADEITEHDDGHWYQDYLEYLGDKAYDSMKDQD